MTKQLEALIAEMKAALEREVSMREQNLSIKLHMSERIAELESTLELEREKSRRVMSQNHRLESSPLAVKLPDRKDIRFWPGDAFEFDTLGYVMAVEEAIRAAGGTIQTESPSDGAIYAAYGNQELTAQVEETLRNIGTVEGE